MDVHERETQAGTRDAGVISVLVVDDHRTVADLLRLAIDGTPGLACVGVAYDAAAAEHLAAALLPGVVICDLNLVDDEPCGLQLARTLTRQHSDMVVLLITGRAGELRLDELRESGASGLLAKDGDLDALLAAVRRASRDRLDIDSGLLRSLTRPVPPRIQLSPREQEVLDRLGKGHDVSRISTELGIRPNTCRGYIKGLLLKLGAHSQLEAVTRAHSMGMLGPRS